MRINTIELTNVRGFTHATLNFQTGLNLIVGINGVGKTTVLESIRILLSHILAEVKSPVVTRENFNKSDININTDSLQLTASFCIDEADYDFLYTKSAKDYATIRKEQPKRTKTSDANIREEGITLEDKAEFRTPIVRSTEQVLLGVFFSTRRSYMNNVSPKAGSSKVAYAAAFVETLSSNRSFSVKMFAEWFNVQQVLAKENSKYEKIVELLKQTIYSFLPGFSDLKVKEDEISKDLTFSIVKAGKELFFSQLSDGERGMLALVFDIARRLIIANVDAENPLDGKAVILIDELDLHLHPKWQRSIVADLERTFPNCQFIATTHSPQIISSVQPEKIQIIKNFDVDQTIKSFGLDINWILKFIMEDSDRLLQSDEAIAAVQHLVDEIEFDRARALIDEYRQQNLDLNEWIVFEAKMAHLEMLGDEEDH